MDLSIRCPQCGLKHIYFSHEVGTEAQCRGCGQALELRPQKALETMRIAWIALLIFLVACAFLFRFSIIGQRLAQPHATTVFTNEPPPADE